MKIKTSEGEHRVTSQGQGNFNSVGAGAGIASFLGFNANNILGNGCGNNNNCGNRTNGDCYETKEASCLREQISVLQAENFSRQAATQAFTDSVTYATTLNDKQGALLEKLSNAVISLQTENATLKSDIRCLSVVNEKDHQILRDYTTSSVNLEAERRACADENLAANFNAKLAWKADYAPYIDGQKVFCPDSSICGGILVAGGCTSCGATSKAVKA